MVNYEKNLTDEYSDARTGTKEEFHFSDNLTARQIYLFVSMVADNTVTDNLYVDPLKSLFFDYSIIAFFTDIDIESAVEGKTLLDSISIIEDILNNTNIVEIVKANMIDGLWDKLEKAINDTIEYRTGVHKRNLEASLENLIQSIETKINEIDIGEFVDFAEKISSISDDLSPEKLVDAYEASGLFKEVRNEPKIREVKKG